MSLEQVKRFIEKEQAFLLKVEFDQQLPQLRAADRSSAFHQSMCDSWGEYLESLMTLNRDMIAAATTEEEIERGLKAENEVIESFLPALEAEMEVAEVGDLAFAHLVSLKKIMELDKKANDLLLEMLRA